MMVLPLVFITVVSRFPTGLILYWMTTNLWTVGQGLVTRRLVPKTPAPKLFGASSGPKRSSRTPAKAEEAKENGAPAAETPKPQAAAAPRQAQEGRRAAVTEVSVEATGETVGEAKWKALRDLERAGAGARQGERSLPGRLGRRTRVARRRLHAGARDRVGRRGRRSAAAGSARRRDRERSSRPRAGRARRRRDGDRRTGGCARGRDGHPRHLHGRRPRPPDRQARPDDRRAAVRRQCGPFPRRHRRQARDGRRRGLPRPAPADARGDRAARCRAGRRAASGCCSSR